MKRAIIIGVMGGGQANDCDLRDAYRLGALIAQNGWVLLNGGRNGGIMAASARGADESGGLTVGILPDDNTARTADHIQIPICTGMGSARNMINVISSRIVVACPGGPGTISEVALALKHSKQVIALNFDLSATFPDAFQSGRLALCHSPEEVIDLIRQSLV
jgi:uncharacterized protein (TIGR00725 family)